MHGFAEGASCVAGSRSKEDPDVWRFVDVQDLAPETRRDVDAFVKGQHSKESGSKGTDARKNCAENGHLTGDCRGHEGGGAEKGTKGNDVKENKQIQMCCKINSMATVVTVECKDTVLKHAGRQVQRNHQGKAREAGATTASK